MVNQCEQTKKIRRQRLPSGQLLVKEATGVKNEKQISNSLLQNPHPPPSPLPLLAPLVPHANVMENPIQNKVMLPALAPENEHQIKHFLVDATLPTALFEALHRRDTGGAGKKKGGGKKGKKKK